MNNLKINVMTISWDPTLAMDSPAFGDVQKRNIEYGKYVKNIFSVTYSPHARHLQEKKLSENVFVFPTNSKNQFCFLFDAWKIAHRICAQNKIDLFLTQDPFLTGLIGWKLKRKYKGKLLIHLHGDFFDNSYWRTEKWFNAPLLWLGKKIIKQADGVRVMSAGQQDKLIEFGIPAEKIKIISTPIDLSYFENYNNQELLNNLKEEAGEGKIILMVGRKDPVKDFETLFAAMNLVYAKNRRVNLWLVGNYESFSEIKDKIKMPAAQVFCFGQIKIENLPAYYKTSSVVVLSSQYESFGKVLVEANACGKPVVSTATTGAKEIIEDGKNGFLVPIGDAAKLAEKILSLLENPEVARQMGERGREVVQERFAGEKQTAKIINFWRDLTTD